MRRFLAALTIAAVPGALIASSALADTTTTSTTTTTVPTTSPTTASSTIIRNAPVAPLTGVSDPLDVTKNRSALTIKIDNTPEAHPQYGINEADVIYEEIVEGGITRLAAIFNSHLPTMVGPVRSVRRTDREIVYPIGGIFAFSGGAQYAVSSIETAPVKLQQESNSGAAMFRDIKRPPPHNLFANAVLLMKFGGKPKPTHALFSYRPSGTAATGPRVNAFSVGFSSGYATSYQWNGVTKSWDRFIFGAPDVTATGVRLSPKNVIVMNVIYRGGAGVEGSYAQLTGSGPAVVFSAGRLQHATWSRSSLSKPIVYTNTSHKVITLTPGQTWVELLDPDQRVSITSQPG